MSWISGTEVQRVDQALRSLRTLLSDVEKALIQQLGPDWRGAVRKLLNSRSEVDLHDPRQLLRILAADLRQGKSSGIISFKAVDPYAAARLKEIANYAKHERRDPKWSEGDDVEAERIANSFLIMAGKRPQRAFASIVGRQQEIFELSEIGSIRHKWYPADLNDPNSPWSKWSAMKCSAASSITAVGEGYRLHIFILATNGTIEQRTWTLEGDEHLPLRERTGRWGVWRGLPNEGLIVCGPINAVSHEQDHLELFAYGEHAETVHRWSWKGEWSPWHIFE
jgi:hypothetical protein